MAKVTGRFEGFTIVKEGKAKNTGKPWKLYSIKVNGKKYGYGFQPPKAAVGDTVAFYANENDNGFWDADPNSFEVTEVGGGSSDAGNGQASRPVSDSDPRQESIETQCALKAAAEIVAAQITAGVSISSPTAAVAVLTTDFKHIIQGRAAQMPAVHQQKPKPKRVAPEDENQDPPFDDEITY